MPPAALSRDTALALWAQAHPNASAEERDHIEVFFDRVLLRGDQVLVYQASVESHHTYGDVKLASYGSAQSLLRKQDYPEHPRTLPDTPGALNWTYEIIGVVDGTK